MKKKVTKYLSIALVILYIILRVTTLVIPYNLFNWFLNRAIVIIETFLLIILFYNQKIIKITYKSIFLFFIVSSFVIGLDTNFLEAKVFKYNDVKMSYKVWDFGTKIIYYEKDDYALIIQKKNNMIGNMIKDKKSWKQPEKMTYNYFSSYDNVNISIKFYYINGKYFQYVEVNNYKEVELLKDNSESEYQKMKTNFKIKENHEYYGKEIDDYKNYKLYYNDKEVKFKERSDSFKKALGIPE